MEQLKNEKMAQDGVGEMLDCDRERGLRVSDREVKPIG